MCWYSSTLQDLSLSGGMLASDDSIAQLHGNRDEVKGRAGARHGNARDGHRIQGIKAIISALVIIELKGCYSICYDLGLCISLQVVAESLVDNKHKEEESRAMDKAHICLSNTIGLATDGERNGVTNRDDGVTLIKT